MEIIAYIKDLLMHYNVVVLPNFGAFEWRYFPARLEAVEHKIYPPSYQLIFNSKHQEDPQDRLVQYIAEKKELDLNQAQALLVDFRLSLEKKLQNKEIVELEDWGELKTQKSGEIILELKAENAFLDPSRGLAVLDCFPILRDKSYLNQNVAASSGQRRAFVPWIIGGAAVLLIAIGGSAFWWWPALMQTQKESTVSEISIIPAITEQQEQLLELISAYENNLTEPIASLEEEDFNAEEENTSKFSEVSEPELTEEAEAVVDDNNSSEEPTPLSPTSEESTDGSNDYIIVIGVFGEPSNYERNARLLREAGYEVQLKKLYTGYTRVAAVVNCSTEEELNEKWAAIRQEFTPKAWIAQN